MSSYEGGCGLASVMKTGCGLVRKLKWTWTVRKAGLFQVSSRSTLRGWTGGLNIEGVQISRDRPLETIFGTLQVKGHTFRALQ